MTTFIMIVLGVAVGITLTSVIACVIMLQPRVWRWYTNKVNGLMEVVFEELDKAIDKEEAKDL